MNYHYLMRPCITNAIGKDVLTRILKVNVENFIDFSEVEKWFDIPKDLMALPDVDQTLDISTNPDFDIIALYVNPYVRVFSYYLTVAGFQSSATVNEIKLEISQEEFTNFVFDGLTKGKAPNMNAPLSSLYQETDTLKIRYKIRYENILEDIKTIPGLEGVNLHTLKECVAIANIYTEYYTDETKKEVESMYKDDFEAYGYTFGQ